MSEICFIESVELLDNFQVPKHSKLILTIHPDDIDQSQIDKAAAFGFANPVWIPYRRIQELSDQGRAYSYSYSSYSYKRASPSFKLCLHFVGEPKSFTEVWKEVEFCLHHAPRSTPVCETQFQINKKSIKFLHYHTHHHKFVDKNGKKRQKEISGLFQMSPISPHLVQVSIDQKRTQVGDSENATSHESVGSFHTHPYEAYKRHKVCVAFPSGEDFTTTLFLYANRVGAFHVLSSIEGIYVITFKPEFMHKYPPRKVFKHLKKWEKYVMDRYDIGYPGCSIDRNNEAFWPRYIAKYLKKVNAMKVFHVQFKSWDKAHEPFDWKFRSYESNCVLSDDQFNHIEAISEK